MTVLKGDFFLQLKVCELMSCSSGMPPTDAAISYYVLHIMEWDTGSFFPIHITQNDLENAFLLQMFFFLALLIHQKSQHNNVYVDLKSRKQ